ncbi:MAG: PEP-CTERM sorting domain-containing protein [Verrucomicrobia bacterium]|nr:PEP-CTERM sorting domain-containing protein [Verrucomicrobiota bacterium]
MTGFVHMQRGRAGRLAVAACLLGMSAEATIVSFQQGTSGYTGCTDNQLLQWASAFNFGGRADLDVGMNGTDRAHTLLWFDLGALSGQILTVNSVTIRLWENPGQAYSPVGVGTVQVHRLSLANAGWSEGSWASAVAGNPTMGDSTYNLRTVTATNPTAGTAWAGSAGAGTAGTDYESAVLGSTPYTTETSGQFDLVLTGDLSFIKAWADGGANPGFILKDAAEIPGVSNRINFRSSENGTVAERPMIIVDYTAIPEPSVGLLLGAGVLLLAARRRLATG